MAMTLTQGAIARIFSDESVYSSDREINPVLQIIDVENRCVSLSDGTNSNVGLLVGNLFNSVAYLEKLQKGSIIKLTVYTLSQSRNRVIFIIDCDVVLNQCDIIGEPVPQPKDAPHRQPTVSNILLKYNALQPQKNVGGFEFLGLSDLGFSDIDIGFSDLTLYDKTKGALEIVSSCANDFKPVLVLQVKESYLISFRGRGYTCLSDGKSVIHSWIPANLVDELIHYEVDILSSGFKDKLLHSTLPEPGTIVQLTDYMLKDFHGIRFIIIIEFDVVLEDHYPIGHVVPLPRSSYDLTTQYITSFLPFNLTQGAIETILSGTFSSDKGFKPVLQMLYISNNTNVMMSDGVYFFYLMCHGNNLKKPFQRRNRMTIRLPVIKVTDYSVHENSENHKVVVILDIEVILYHNTCLLGNPAIPPNTARYLGVYPPKPYKDILRIVKL